MAPERVTVRVDSTDGTRTDSRDMSVRRSAVGREVLRLAGSVDVTLTVEVDGAQLMIAVTGDNAFVGLFDGAGVHQWAVDGRAPGRVPFVVGGQPTDMESRYVVDVPTAAEIAMSWLGRPASAQEAGKPVSFASSKTVAARTRRRRTVDDASTD